MALQRYVIANRRSGKFDVNSKMVSRSNVAMALNAFGPSEIVSDLNPTDPLARRVAVVAAEPDEMAARKAEMPPDIIVEPEILFWPDIVPAPEFLPVRRAAAGPLSTAGATEYVVTVTGGGTGLPHAEVLLLIDAVGGAKQLKGKTDAGGYCRFQIPFGGTPRVAMIVPVGGFWPMLVRGEALNATVECPPLPTSGPLGWWHDVLGIDRFDLGVGAGIKVGVADTGAGPHANLSHITPVGAFVDGEIMPPESALDVDFHGTHVAGTIGARPSRPGDYGGVAPGSSLLVSRIYRTIDDGASNADIANAIDALSRTHKADLINLSLGSTTPSKIVHDAIIDAAERGTLCLCASGNDGGAVNYPAAFREAIAVGAVGRQGWGPPGTMTAARLPQDQTLFGADHLFAANFSSHGSEVACAGPGVGIISSVPNPFNDTPSHAGLDGTSMACPVVCGSLAVLLSRDSSYQALPRDHTRTEAARRTLREALRDMGLPTTFGGRGIPGLGALAS
jgi:subtilisin family serine protease